MKRFLLPASLLLSVSLSSPAAPKLAGLILDDGEAELTGEWVESTKQPALIGRGYRHDNNTEQGHKSAVFVPKITEAGEYEVRLLFSPTSNRATNVPVIIVSADGEKVVRLDQRERDWPGGLAPSLGVYRFAPDQPASITITNAGADGFVVIDGVQLAPAAVALAERVSSLKIIPKAEDQFAARRLAQAAAVALSPLGREAPAAQTAPLPPIELVRSAAPEAVDGQEYDLVVIGGTGSGVVCAVRAAREGCRVLLVQHNAHLGGMMSNGLMQWDALYGGPRAPLFTELLGNIERHYIAKFGENSRDHQVIRYTHEHYPVGWAEPHVAEREFNRLVAGEKKITVLLDHYASAAERDGALLRSVTLRAYAGTKEIRVRGAIFADATYEGDLLPLAKVPYRVGREARAEFQEPHAGQVFTNIDHAKAPREALEARLNIHPYSSRQGTIDPASPFSADGAVQAYNYRFCVTKDPANRVLLAEPPLNYQREEYVDYNRKSIATNAGPNQKSHMNSPILPGENHAYPEAAWPAREKIIQRHRDFALGLMWFLQNDSSLSEAKREQFRQWGLPKDEFADHGHIPYEMYVREARRLTGRHVFREQDNSLAEGFARTPVMADSIAITDWYMDSHSCTTESRPGFPYDGKLILTEESRPAQIPYRALLPREIDNLLVPVCLSATHLAWGAVRLEPVWMQTGEAAGLAAALALKQKIAPGKLDPEQLLRALVQRRHLVSFFNELKVDAPEPWIPAFQYFGAKGFFASYEARPRQPLNTATARAWAGGFAQLRAGQLDPNALARAVAAAEAAESPAIPAAEFARLLPGAPALEGPSLTRAEAMQVLYGLLK